MSHALVVLADIHMRNAWYPKFTLTNGLSVHSWWKRSMEFKLTGE